MKMAYYKWFIVMLLGFLANGCAQLNLPMQIPVGNQPSGQLTNAEIVRGLKEALTVGAQNSSSIASKTDGFFKNQELFIPFPQEAIKVKNTLESAGITKPIDDFVLSMNRAAEDASKKAFPIFKNAITSMTIADAMGILKGGDNAATNYLKNRTTSQLKAEFQPIVRQSISNVKVTSYWSPIVTNYNRLTLLTGGSQVNPNLEEYITERTIEGLFILVAKEEQKIRKDPAARVTDILKKVFGN